MSRLFTAALRRANRLLRPRKLSKATRSLQKAMTGVVIKTAQSPLSALSPKAAKVRKIVTPRVSLGLGAVLKQLRAARSLVAGAIPGSAGRNVSPQIPDGAQYLTRRHRNTTGSRSYKLYLPASNPRRPKGLILMLHGCTQTPDDFAVGTHMNALAERQGLAIAYPAQTVRDNAARCWNWFNSANQVRGSGEPAILASLARKLKTEFGLDRDAVFVAGLSAGGAMAAVLADVYPDVFSAAGIHSGLARGAAQDMSTAVTAMRKGGTPGGTPPGVALPSDPVRRIVFHGDTDTTVHPSNASMIVAAAMGGDAAPAKVTKRSFRGRSYVRSVFAGPDGAVQLEFWMIEGAGHAWSGGRVAGSFTDAKGPDASAQMVRFFLAGSAKGRTANRAVTRP